MSQLCLLVQILYLKKLTSYPAVKENLTNAGAHWIDKSAVIDDNLVTNRSPIDLFAEVQRKKIYKIAMKVFTWI
jgi:protease I